jgi:DNA-binding response OmpR family regulator
MFRRPRTGASVRSDAAPSSGANGSTVGDPAPSPTSAVSTVEAPPVVRHGRITVDPEGRVVTVDSHEAELTRTEFDLLTTLLSAPRRVWSRAVLLDSLWGPGWSEEHLVEVHVGNLRRKLTKLGPTGMRAPIRTVRGVGYRMEEPDAF